MPQDDAFGLTLSTDSKDAAAAWNKAVPDFLEYRLTTGNHIKAALEADPDFVMGLCFRGYFLMQLGTTAVAGKVREVLGEAKARLEAATPRERRHVVALEHWLNGRPGEACREWEAILVEAPTDFIALRLHHFSSFWRGDREALRGEPASVLGRIDEATPGYNFALGMLAFGLEECGDYAAAEHCGRKAVALNGDDLWAIHSVAHVLEMQCRHDEGAAFLSQPFSAWADRNPFKDHVWWHTALFALELGDHDRVLDIYDREVKVKEGGFYLDVQNAASLLMRLELAGVDVGDRWRTLAALAEQRIDDHVLPFTDAHFMLALTGAHRLDAARSYLDSLERFAAGGSEPAQITATHTVPVAKALLAYADGRYGDAADRLLALRHDLGPLGGSHAQQDVFHQILIDAAMRAGRPELARSLLAERMVLRPGSDWARERLRELASSC